MPIKKTIAIISFSPLHRDPRIKRQIAFLGEKQRIVAIGLSDPGVPGVEFIKVHMKDKGLFQKTVSGVRLLTRQFESHYWSYPHVQESLQKCQNLKFSLIIANDIETLPLSIRLAGKQGAKILFDAHEYAPLQFEDVLQWQIFFQRFKTKLCAQYIPQSHCMVTVSDGIAEKYRKEFGAECHVITNASDYVDITPTLCRDNQIRMICHGVGIASRKYEILVDVMQNLDKRFTLDFILVPEPYKALRKKCEGQERIRFLDPLPFEKIIPFSNQYDIGIFHVEPSSFNKKHVLPNKFFEFVQSRLALAFPPLPEIAPLIRKYQCGIVADDFTPRSLAKKLIALDAEQINTFKQNANQAAKELCSDKNKTLFQEIVTKLIG